MTIKLGRNDPCHCGSGKKFKNCCQGRLVLGQTRPSAPSDAELARLGNLFNAGQILEVENQAYLLSEQFPGCAAVWKLLGASRHLQGKDGLPALRRAVELQPTDATAHSNLGNALKGMGQFENAAESYRLALKLAPNMAGIHYNLGHCLRDLGKNEAAISSYRQALVLKPNFAEAHCDLGNALSKLGKLDLALASYRQALAIAPDYAEAHYNFGNALQETGQFNEAIAHYKHALLLKPDFPEAIFSMGIASLFLGRWDEGWKYYEARWEGSTETAKVKANRPSTSLPQWLGHTEIAKDNLLVITEQGMGDNLQFSRYLPLLAERFAKVSFSCSPGLVRLFRASFSPVIEVLETHPIDQSAWHWQCPIMSLPLAFGTDLKSIPNKIPYLQAPLECSEKWQKRLKDIAGSGLKIGLVWSGNKNLNAKRSIDLSKFATLLRENDNTWISLQKGASEYTHETAETAGMIDWMSEITDFADTAGLISALDLVISVDTSVAHLAGALGKPVWMLNRFESDWRWMRNRQDSPWYPTMKIFNQKTAGNWEEVLAQVGIALGSFQNTSSR